LAIAPCSAPEGDLSEQASSFLHGKVRWSGWLREKMSTVSFSEISVKNVHNQ
jgi:hypothetical protein